MILRLGCKTRTWHGITFTSFRDEIGPVSEVYTFAIALTSELTHSERHRHTHACILGHGLQSE